MIPSDFIAKALPEAIASAHVFPEYSVCEAALESAWGTSALAVKANNLFGQKSGKTSLSYPLVQFQTREYVNGRYTIVPASWPVFPDWKTSFEERMHTLRSLPFYYEEALEAKTGEEFVRLVSVHWSSDPLRADKVLKIYSEHEALLNHPGVPR